MAKVSPYQNILLRQTATMAVESEEVQPTFGVESEDKQHYKLMVRAKGIEMLIHEVCCYWDDVDDMQDSYENLYNEINDFAKVIEIMREVKKYIKDTRDASITPLYRGENQRGGYVLIEFKNGLKIETPCVCQSKLNEMIVKFRMINELLNQ
jgi:hypothetical protein